MNTAGRFSSIPPACVLPAACLLESHCAQSGSVGLRADCPRGLTTFCMQCWPSQPSGFTESPAGRRPLLLVAANEAHRENNQQRACSQISSGVASKAPAFTSGNLNDL